MHGGYHRAIIGMASAPASAIEALLQQAQANRQRALLVLAELEVNA